MTGCLYHISISFASLIPAEIRWLLEMSVEYGRLSQIVPISAALLVIVFLIEHIIKVSCGFNVIIDLANTIFFKSN